MEGPPKLLDFGLAHAVDDAAIVGGTPGGGAAPHPATAHRCRRACRNRPAVIGGGRGRLRGVDPDGPPARTAGHRARLRRGAGRSLRERVAETFFKLFSPCLFGSLLPYVIGVYWEFKSAFLPEGGPV